MRILVVGAGAVGGIFGARLTQAGRDVTFLVRAGRAELIRRDGLRIASPNGDVTLHPKLISADGLDRAYDIIILSVKCYGLTVALEDFAPAVAPGTVVLPVMNGMRHMDALKARFGDEVVIGGLCRVAAQVDDEGRIRQLARFQTLAYGELDGCVTERVRSVDAAMQGAGFEAKLSTDIVQEMWDKWVQLAALGAITCLFRGTVGAVAAVPGGADLSRSILHECALVATACGYRPSEAFLAGQGTSLTEANSSLTSSMFRDLSTGAPVEVEEIIGDLLGRAEASGVVTPLLQAAFVNLRVYQDHLERQADQQR
jgi:2-dehydropantoate 2-reductase